MFPCCKATVSYSTSSALSVGEGQQANDTLCEQVSFS